MLDLQNFINSVKEQNINMDAVAVVKEGVLLGLHRFSDTVIHNVFSVAKSHTGAAIGFAIDEGKLKLTDRPVDFFADVLPANIDPRWNNVTLFNLLTMSTGHGAAHLMVIDRKMLREKGEKEWLTFAFTRPMPYEPGEKFVYGNLAPYVAGRMLEKAVGVTVCDYLYEKMWKRMGVKKPLWETDPAGHTFAASDLYLDIVDMAKLGELYAAGGCYKSERYLSEEWVKTAGSKHFDTYVMNPGGYCADEEAGYGFYFWRNKEIEGSYRCYGREGQFVIILPEKNAVIATQAMNSNVEPILSAVWKHILPQI
jgi:CubicO group peptidase (beta-lactamase class C family)